MMTMDVRASDAFSEEAASFIAERLQRRLAEGHRATLAVSGGSTPWRTFSLLSEAAIDWNAVDVFQVDERCVAADDPARNYRGLHEALLSKVPAIGHPMPVEEADPDAAAARYAASLPDRFDVVQLGIGSDGHTASLVPGDPALTVTDRDVAIAGPYQGSLRMTLTYPAINRARSIVWIVKGAEKRDAVAALLSGDPAIPATGVAGANAVLFADPSTVGR